MTYINIKTKAKKNKDKMIGDYVKYDIVKKGTNVEM